MEMTETKDRLKVIMQTSIIGIIVNVCLAVFKMVVGLITKSIAITMDGVNNLSDAGSSVITILGAALAGKPADKKHPFGYGRMEYLSALIISGLVLYAGITSAVESVKKIIHPEESDYSLVILALITVAIFVKFGLALFTEKRGIETNSDSLVASGKDAIMDVMLSTATLVAAIIYTFFHVSLEAYLGLIIAVFIIKAGIELLLETISKILGEPSEIDTVIQVKKTVASFDEVHGAYDLILNDYGPDNYVGSVHIEVDDDMTADKLDELIRKITEKVQSEHGIYLSAISIYSKNTKDNELHKMEEEARKIALSQEYVRGFHGFYANMQEMKMSFDLVISMDAKDRKAVHDKAIEEILKVYPGYAIKAGMDIDFNELHKN